MSAPVQAGFPRWWETDVVNLFGITTPVLPTMFALAALWVGREIARNPKRKLTKRQNFFLNIGLVIVTFLVVTGRMFGTHPLELGWSAVMGFGIGMNGLVIFEIFQNFTYAFFTRGTNAVNFGDSTRDDAPDSQPPADRV